MWGFFFLKTSLVFASCCMLSPWIFAKQVALSSMHSPPESIDTIDVSTGAQSPLYRMHVCKIPPSHDGSRAEHQRCFRKHIGPSSIHYYAAWSHGIPPGMSCWIPPNHSEPLYMYNYLGTSPPTRRRFQPDLGEPLR